MRTFRDSLTLLRYDAKNQSVSRCKILQVGYKILWLAHTHHLLEQAYVAFQDGVSHIVPPREKLDVVKRAQRLPSGGPSCEEFSVVIGRDSSSRPTRALG